MYHYTLQYNLENDNTTGRIIINVRRSNLDLLETTVGGIVRPEGESGTVPHSGDTREATEGGLARCLTPGTAQLGTPSGWHTESRSALPGAPV